MNRQRMRLTIDTAGRVTIAYSDAFTERRITRTFRAPDARGYVIELMPDGNSRQVCDGLARMGNTLMADRESLPEVIRRHYRALRAFQNSKIRGKK